MASIFAEHNVKELVLQGGKTAPVADVLKGKKYLMIYFSAHWCPPCRGFTPELAKFYETIKKEDRGDQMELVFVSSDKDQDSFDGYFGEMPWTALPFSERDAKTALAKQFKCNGIPHLVVVDAQDGTLITDEGRAGVSNGKANNYADFPWKKSTPAEFLFEHEGGFVSAQDFSKKVSSSSVADEADYIGLYFTASWCGPCRGFTPELVKFYDAVNRNGSGGGKKKLEIVTVSWDKTEEDAAEYCSKMPWLAIPWGDSRLSRSGAPVSVNGIPTLAIFDAKTGKIISDSARGNVGRDPNAEHFPWTEGIPLPDVNALDNLFDEIIEAFECQPTVVLNANLTKEKKDVDAALVAFAAAKKKVANGVSTTPKNALFMNTTHREGRPSKDQCAKGHPLKKEDGEEWKGRLSCDGCGKGQILPSYRCSECDSDLCEECYNKEAVPLNRSQQILGQIGSHCSKSLEEGSFKSAGEASPDGGFELCFFSMLQEKWKAVPLARGDALDADALAAAINAGFAALYPK